MQISDNGAVKALLKIMNEHKMQGSEAPAFLHLVKWVNELPDRLKPEPIVMPEGNDGDND